MNLRNLSLGLVALVGFGLLITMNAFTNVNEKKSFTYWQYEPGDATNIRDGASYTQIVAPDEQPCEQGSALPCVLKVDANIDTEAELDTYLHNTSLFPAASDITNSAIYKKPTE